MNTCRQCSTRSAAGLVKYGARHYLCASCAIGRGLAFLLTLKTWQLENLPFGPLKAAGLLVAVQEAVAARKAAEK